MTASEPGQPAPAPSGARPAQPPARPRGGGSIADMVRTVVVVLAVLLVLGLVFGRPDGRIERPVDAEGATERAVAAGLPVAVPELPQGWELTGARYLPDTTEGLPTWHLGYLTPEEEYAGVDVTAGATPAWVTGVSAGGVEDGEREVAGTTWRLLDDGEDPARRSLVRVEGDVTTVVSGRAPLEDLDTLAEAVSG